MKSDAPSPHNLWKERGPADNTLSLEFWPPGEGRINPPCFAAPGP